MKSFIKKRTTVVIKYRDFKNDNAAAFHAELYYALRLIKHTDINYGLFESTFMGILNKSAPLKEKRIRVNTGPFMNRELSKAFMTRTRLRNNSDNKILYKKQRNFCVNLLRNAKRDYYKNLEIKHVTDNKKFWKTVRPHFSEKHNISRNITLVEDDKILSNDSEVAKTMNDFFSFTVTNIDIKGHTYLKSEHTNIDPVIDIITNFKDHPSIEKIRERMKEKDKFSFSLVNEYSMKNEIKNLNINKPTT